MNYIMLLYEISYVTLSNILRYLMLLYEIFEIYYVTLCDGAPGSATLVQQILFQI